MQEIASSFHIRIDFSYYVCLHINSCLNVGRFPDIMSKYWREKKHQGRCEAEILNDKKIGWLTCKFKFRSKNDQLKKIASQILDSSWFAAKDVCKWG